MKLSQSKESRHYRAMRALPRGANIVSAEKLSKASDLRVVCSNGLIVIVSYFTAVAFTSPCGERWKVKHGTYGPTTNSTLKNAGFGYGSPELPESEFQEKLKAYFA